MGGNSSHSRIPIPTVSELLESPPIRALADRWSKTAVATGLRTFLEELRSDLTRSGNGGSWPSPRELAERAARHIMAMQDTSQRPAINATGQIWGPKWVGCPQSDKALEQAFAAGREFVLGPDILTTPANSHFAGDVETLVCRVTGAEAATAIHSYASALWLAVRALATGREILVARGEVGEVAPGCPLNLLIASAGATLCEVGVVNRTTIADFERELTSKSAAVLSVFCDSYRVVGSTSNTTREERVALARDRGLVAMEAVGVLPLVDTEARSDSLVGGQHDCARQRLIDGVQLIIVRSDGYLGGPPSGIIAGERRLVEQITRHPMYSALELDPQRRVALSATLKNALGAAPAEMESPISELLSTPSENLRHRADRLATQLSQTAGIAVAETVSLRSQIREVSDDAATLSSFGVSLQPADGDAVKLAKRLADGPLPIVARVEDGRVIIDLRTVFPRHDGAIVAALLGHRGAASPSPAVPVTDFQAATQVAE
jgi:L-seryl-tRNA(Ser) seleniumtransferase